MVDETVLFSDFKGRSQQHFINDLSHSGVGAQNKVNSFKYGGVVGLDDGQPFFSAFPTQIDVVPLSRTLDLEGVIYVHQLIVFVGFGHERGHHAVDRLRKEVDPRPRVVPQKSKYAVEGELVISNSPLEQLKSLQEEGAVGDCRDEGSVEVEVEVGAEEDRHCGQIHFGFVWVYHVHSAASSLFEHFLQPLKVFSGKDKLQPANHDSSVLGQEGQSEQAADSLVESGVLDGRGDAGYRTTAQPVVSRPGVNYPHLVAIGHCGVVEVVELNDVHGSCSLPLAVGVYPQYPRQSRLNVRGPLVIFICCPAAYKKEEEGYDDACCDYQNAQFLPVLLEI